MPSSDVSRTRLPRSLLCLGIGAALCAANPTLAAETLLLEISVNDQRLDGIILAERLDDGRLALPAEAWASARLKPATQSVQLSDGGTAYTLESVPGLDYRLDLARLTLSVSAPASAFETSRFDIGGDPLAMPTAPPPGFYLDYDLSATHARNGGNSAGALFEAVVFNRWGALVSGAAWRSNGQGSELFRTDTYWRRDIPQRMETLVIGDTVSSAGGWSRPLRYAGVRYARDFDTAPGYITYPMPSISGSAALPSTVDLLVNNQRSASSTVQPGPFELDNVPIVSGAGEMQLVVRDLLGRETVVRQGFYVAPQLLAPGLSDFSYEAGMMRLGYGSRDDRYERAFASGTYRRGLSDWFTGEVRVEVERDRRAAGVALTALVGRLGVVGLAAGFSDADGQRGVRYVATAQRIGPTGGLSLSYSHADRDFREFGALENTPALREQFSASAGARLGRRLSGGMNYTRQSEWDGKRFSLISANLGMQLQRGAYLSVSASRRMDEDRAWSATINFILPLGQRRVLAAGSTRQYDGQSVTTVQASQQAPSGPGWGWRVRASDRASNRLEAAVVFNRNAGQYIAEANLGRGNDAVRVGASGSIGRLKGLSFASRRIDQGAFAVVRVGDVPGVPVSLSNQVVATTNRKGLALVTGLLPYQSNRLSIDPDQMPLDAQVDGVLASSVPYARSGAYVEFPVRRSRSALLVLSRADGSPVPAGARVFLGPGLSEFTVARRGEVYLTGIGDAHRLDVRWNDGRCSAQWRHVPSSRDASARTPLTCGPIE